ncbi:MAG: Trk family potassium uptake protein, partial [Acholeplasmatales bacterium]
MKKVSPYLIIVASFLSLILVGTILLFLPISQASRGALNFVDSFFLATSAVTNTGLSPVADLSVTLTLFGKIVLIVLV